MSTPLQNNVVPICTGKRFPCTEVTREQASNVCMEDAAKWTNRYYIRNGNDYVEWVAVTFTGLKPHE